LTGLRSASYPVSGEGSPTDGFQGIKREHGEDDPIGAETVAAPATVSGEPAVNSDHWETGKVDDRRKAVSQETCLRDAVALRLGRGRPMWSSQRHPVTETFGATACINRKRG